MSQEQRRGAGQAWSVRLVCVLGLCALGGSALDLSADGIARYLNSDFLTPHFFCLNLLSGGFPLSGWTLSASPYFFPDHLVMGGLLTGFDRMGQAYALFTLVYYLALFGLMGLCVRDAVGRSGPALVAGLLGGSGLLALRWLPGHALYLWWLGAPCCHGGVLLLGFAYLWVLGTGLRRGRVGFRPAGLFVLAWAGLWSDTLFLFQILLPAGAALFLCRRHPACGRWLPWQGGGTAAALVGSLGLKLICRLAGWFYFSPMIRVAPTPANQFHALGQFAGDLPHLLHDGWGFALTILAAAATLVGQVRKWAGRDGAATQGRGDSGKVSSRAGVFSRWLAVPGGESGGGDMMPDFFRVFCVASLLLMLPLPVLTCAWRSANCVRYLFNWVVLPVFLLALWGAEQWVARADAPGSGQRLRRWLPAGAGVVFAGLLGSAAYGLRGEPLRFPYPADVAALDAVLQRRGLRYGLAQYWDAKYVTALSHAGAEVRQVRADGGLYFWDNNAFGYYAHDGGGTVVWPAYQYVLVDRLDEPAVRRVFGDPQSEERAGRYQVWIYADEGQRRIRQALETGVREKLGPTRWRRVETGK